MNILRFNHFLAKEWKKFSLILLFDILFAVSLIVIRLVFLDLSKMLLFFIEPGLVYSAIGSLTLLFVFVLVYSYFKSKILNLLGKKLGFSGFFKLNLKVLLPLLVANILFFSFAGYYLGVFSDVPIDNPRIAIAILIRLIIVSLLALLIFVYSYTLLNLSHSSHKSLRGLIKESFYLENYKVYWLNIKVIVIFFLAIISVHAFVRLFLLNTPVLYYTFLVAYKTFIFIVALLMWYYLVLFNRVWWNG